MDRRGFIRGASAITVLATMGVPNVPRGADTSMLREGVTLLTREREWHREFRWWEEVWTVTIDGHDDTFLSAFHYTEEVLDDFGRSTIDRMISEYINSDLPEVL